MFEQCGPAKDLNLIYSAHETWDSMLQQDGLALHNPTQQQIPFTRSLSSGSAFVAYIDAIGELDEDPA